jgi:hypothetical protein
MHRDHHADGHYTGPDRRKLERRKMVLQEDDIGIIKSIVTDAVEEKVVGHCRYNIEPVDMDSLMAFVKAYKEGEKDREELLAFVRVFHKGAVEIKGATRSLLIKKVIPRLIIGTLLTILADYLGLLRPVLNAAMRVMKGGG